MSNVAIDNDGVVSVNYEGRWIVTDAKTQKCIDCDEWNLMTEYKQGKRGATFKYCKPCKRIRQNNTRRVKVLQKIAEEQKTMKVKPPEVKKLTSKDEERLKNIEIMKVPQRDRTTYLYWIADSRQMGHRNCGERYEAPANNGTWKTGQSYHG